MVQAEIFADKFLNEDLESIESLTQEFTSSLSLSLQDGEATEGQEKEESLESYESSLKIGSLYLYF